MNDQSPRYVVGVDIGGTFTDVFFLDQAAGRAEVAKVSSTICLLYTSPSPRDS